MRLALGKPSALVYTAIFGGYDTLKQPPRQDAPCEFVCFTDADLPPRVGAWKIVKVPLDQKSDAVMQAKRIKLLSHRVIPGAALASGRPFIPRLARRVDMSIWIDGSLNIRGSSFIRDMRTRLGQGDWAFFVHPDRDCVYDEAVASLTLRKYKGLPLLEQVDSYRDVVPQHSGLYASGIIVRREPVPVAVIHAQELWWEENLKWSFQCQLSLPYAIRKIGKGCQPVPIFDSLWENDWFDVVPHN